MPRGNDTERLETEHSMPLRSESRPGPMIVQMGVKGEQRRDALANRQTVVESAIELLGLQPDASIQEIADHSGVGRTTVYRHFPGREELFDALIDEVFEQSIRETNEVLDREKPAHETLMAVSKLNIELGLRYRFIYTHLKLTKPTIQDHTRASDSPITKYLAGAQDRGEVRRDQPIAWLRAAFLSLTMLMVGEVLAQRFDPEEAGTVLGETLAAAMVTS